jgi:hypothetical protein
MSEGRKLLDALLVQPLTFTAIDSDGGRRYRIGGAATVGAMFTNEASPTGFEPVLQP